MDNNGTAVYPATKPEEPIIFLDIDGVMTSARYNRWLHRRGIDNPHCEIFSPIAMGSLIQIVHDTHALIVISSAWRKKHDLKWIADHFMNSGFPYPWNLIGMTGTGHNGVRGAQISEWIDTMGITDRRFVIIDDSTDGVSDNIRLAGNALKIDPESGLAREDVGDAVNILRGDYGKVFLPGDEVIYRDRQAKVVGRGASIRIVMTDGSAKNVSRNSLRHTIAEIKAP